MYRSFQIESYGLYGNLAGFFKTILEHVASAMLSVQNV